ncbi:DUF2169 domain-containing protein [Pseudomonas marincola]|uniref:DUF2169 domain-containing protein n=1 Tax=Pseudomonas marincola TaxID=437900 RepID=UPI000B89BC4A
MCLQDTWRDEPKRSSLLYPSDLTAFKPTTEVLIVGTVRPPESHPLSTFYALLRIG